MKIENDMIDAMAIMLGINGLVWILIGINGLNIPLVYAMAILNILISINISVLPRIYGGKI